MPNWSEEVFITYVINDLNDEEIITKEELQKAN